jgi:Ras-related protein Rab-5C
MPSPAGRRHKVVFLGPSSSGKTSLIQRFVKGTFGDKEPTIGTAFYTREVASGGAHVALKIWDTAGMERYRSLVPKYARGAAVAVIVFDAGDAASFAAAREVLADAPALCDPDTVTLLVANKLDAAAAVDLREAGELAEAHGAVLAQTSAKTGEGVDELFEYVAGRLAGCEALAPGADRAVTVGAERGAPARCCG